MADVSKTVAIIFQGQDQASAVSGKIADDIKDIGASAGTSSGKVDDLTKATDKLGDTARPVGLLTDAMKALAASLVFKAFVDANVEAEKFERAMTLLKGSTEDAAKEFTYIQGVSRTLGLSLFDAADAYVSLTAATKGTKLEGEDTREIFEAVSKAMGSLGKSSADTQGALLAVSQIVSKGNVSLEELRGQLGERLPGAFQIAANAMGVTTQELDKLVSSGNLTAEEFLPKFAAALRDTFGETTFVDGYAASFARLQNSISEAFVVLGNAGTFDALTKGVQVATASVTGAIASFELLGTVVGIFAGALGSGNFSGVGDAISEAMNKAADRTSAARDALLNFTDSAGKAEDSAKSAGGGVNLFAGDVRKYEEAQKLASDATDKASKSSKEQTDALAKQAKETQRAEEAAQKYALEIEKLASNERIKSLEFRAEIDVARIQADAQKVTAAFESISVGIQSTGDVLGDLFGLFSSLDGLDSSARNALFQQIDKENTLREKSFELQRELTQAQIASLKAQTRNLERGDAIIKIDGAGLQPQLEAFMWEILRAIQVRVNSQGLNLLLGV